MTQTQEINKQKIKDVDIIKIDFILDLEIWVILQQSDQEAADCSHVSEREREYEGKDEKKTQQILKSVFTRCVIIHRQLNPDFSFCCSFWVYSYK